MLDGRHSCFLFYQIAEVIGGKAEFVGTILHCRDAFCQGQARLVIIIKQRLEACKQVAVRVFAGNELAVIEADATVEEQFDGVDYKRVAVLVDRMAQFLCNVFQTFDDGFALLFRQMKGFVGMV